MKKGFGVLVFVTLLFLLSSEKIHAQVVINEVSPNGTGTSEPDEFIELYNKGPLPEVITGWTLSDTTGSIKTYILPEKTLNVGEFFSYRRSITNIVLNNDGDGVIMKDINGDVKNQISFSSYSDKEGRSFSRIPDGSDSFVDYTELSEGLPNIAPPTPTPTPTSSPTSSPTATPAQAASTSSTHTPTPTPTPIKTIAPTVKPTVIPTATFSPSPNPTPTRTSQPQVLSASDKVSPIPSSSPKTESRGFPFVAVIFLLIGVGLIGFAFWPFVQDKLNRYTVKDVFKIKKDT